jgi:AbiV family abortive infection protein
MSEKEKFLRKVALLCLQNAERYVKDAEILIKKRSSGHAFALAVLAEEELAKAVMYHLCAEGIFGIEGKWKSDISWHKRKQQFAFGIAWVYEMILMIEEASEFAMKKAKGKVSEARQIYEKKIAELYQKEQTAFALKRGEAYKHLRRFEGLQDKRIKAMYVDADLKNEKVTCPKDFEKSKAKQYLSDVEEIVDALKDEIKGKLRLQDKQRAMFLMKKRLSVLNEETKRKQLEWYGLSVEDLDKFTLSL